MVRLHETREPSRWKGGPMAAAEVGKRWMSHHHSNSKRVLFTLTASLFLVTSCRFSPHPKDGKLPCTEGCPSGYSCRSDNFCYKGNPVSNDGGNADSSLIGRDKNDLPITQAGQKLGVDGSSMALEPSVDPVSNLDASGMGGSLGMGGLSGTGGSVGTGGSAGTGGSGSGGLSAQGGKIGSGGGPGGAGMGGAIDGHGGALDIKDAGSPPDSAVIVTCPALVAPIHSEVLMTSLQVGGKATYTCNTGYSSPIPSIRTCQTDGTWSGANPSCEIVNCGQPEAPANGRVKAPITTFGAEATYFCESGYNLIGNTVRLCKADGTWGGKVPSCQCQMTVCADACVDLNTDNRHCGACGKTCSAVAPSTAECTPTGCLVKLAMSKDSARDIIVDSTNVYWLDDANVMKVPLGGGISTTLASDQGFADDIAIDATNVYWAAHSDETVMKVPKAGGPPVALATGQNGPGGLAVNATELYYICNRGVMRMPLAGGSSTVLAPSPSYSIDEALVLDATNVYWRSDGLNNVINKIMKQSLETGSTPITLATPSSIGSLALDATNIYWTMPEGGVAGAAKLAKAPLEGGATTILATGLETPSDIAVDGTYVYWTVWAQGTVMKMPVTGGTPIILASDQGHPSAIVLDATSVYWTDAYGPIMKLTPR